MSCFQAKTGADMQAAAEKGDLAVLKGCLVKGVDIDTRTEVCDQPKSASLLMYSLLCQRYVYDL
jgi:hypothetical protein